MAETWETLPLHVRQSITRLFQPYNEWDTL
jgi:hypothetical protein